MSHPTTRHTLTEQYLYAAGPTGILSGNCLSSGSCSFCLDEDTPISINGELIPIKQTYDLEYEGDIDARLLDTPSGQKPCKGIAPTGKKECITLTTGDGRTLTLTPDHKMLTVRDGLVVCIEAGHLKPGTDTLILTSNITKYTPPRDSGARDFLYPPPAGSRESNAKLAAAQDTARQASQATQATQADTEGAVRTLTDNLEKQAKDQGALLTRLRKFNAYAVTLTASEPAGLRETADVWSVTNSMFVANGFITHNCHTDDTRIVLADGTTKPINEVQPGHLIVTAAGYVRPVVHTWKREVTNEPVVTWQTKDLNKPITSTADHRFTIIPASAPDNPKWEHTLERAIGDLEPGDALIGGDSTPLAPTRAPLTVHTKHTYTGTVYNLEVSPGDHDIDPNTYRLGNPQQPRELPTEVRALSEALEALSDEEHQAALEALTT